MQFEMNILLINGDLFVSGFAVALTLIDPVPQSFSVAFHLFGVISFAQGLCTALLTLLAADCVRSSFNFKTHILLLL